MNCKKYINLLFSGTSNYIKYATVTILSALENLQENVGINVYFLYADIIEPIDEDVKNAWIEQVLYTFRDKNVNFNFIDVSDKMHLVENLNIGMWGREISLTHYIYLLAPLIIKNVDKIIYLDCDMIVNYGLSEVFDNDMGDNLIALAKQHGFELDEEDFNSGFSVINLKQWIKEDTLTDIIKFGEQLPKSDFCDQYLLNEYFGKTHSNRIMLFDKKYNLFPITYPELNLSEIKILHYAGPNIKPWYDLDCNYRGSFLWWQYARETVFYESFIADYIMHHRLCIEDWMSKDYNEKIGDCYNRINDCHNRINDCQNIMNVCLNRISGCEKWLSKCFETVDKHYKKSIEYIFLFRPFEILVKMLIIVKLKIFEQL
ncbi:hypothetical protein IJG72_08245 [bacterium]|nr:hypothetical protein [bacterium]